MQLLADFLTQRVQILQAHTLGQFVVDSCGNQLLQFLDIDVEDRILPSQFGPRIFRRERDLDLALVADLGADQLILEPRNQLAGAEAHMMALGLAAGEFLAVDAAQEVNDQHVIPGRRPGFAHRLALRLFVGQSRQGLVDFGLRHIDDRARQF